MEPPWRDDFEPVNSAYDGLGMSEKIALEILDVSECLGRSMPLIPRLIGQERRIVNLDETKKPMPLSGRRGIHNEILIAVPSRKLQVRTSAGRYFSSSTTEIRCFGENCSSHSWLTS